MVFHDVSGQPMEAQEMPDYEGPYDGQLPDDLEVEEHVVSHPKHLYNLRPRQKRSCSPARRAAPVPRTVPR